MNLAKIDDVVIDSITSEDLSRSASVTSRPTETGFVNDHVEHDPYTLDISGVVVNSKVGGAWERMQSIRDKHIRGDVVYYVHRGTARGIITKLDTGTNISGGLTFSLTIQNVRMAKSHMLTRSNNVPTQVSVQTKEITNLGSQPVRNR